MKRLLALVLALVLALIWLPAMADLVASKGSDAVRLTDVACPPTMAVHLPPEIFDRFRAAVAIVDGKTYLGCWALRGDGRVFLRYEDGDAGVIPLRDFKNEPGI